MIFLLPYLQMTPLVSKKMDQFLGESGDCLFVITTHAAKTKLRPAQLRDCVRPVPWPEPAACPAPVPGVLPGRRSICGLGRPAGSVDWFHLKLTSSPFFPLPG